MTGYVRKDTSNNIADGNIINAADLDAEFDGVVDAFNASTGHKHDGTAGEGAPITVVGPTQDVTVSATAVTPKTTNTVDLGSSSLKFKDIFIAGTATLPTVSATTGNITTVNATTVDTTNVEVTNIKAKDGTASATIADSTGVMTIASAILTTADINGGTIDGTVIGGTAAAAGAFTTLSASGGVTLSAGTANGVAYLNGSKVLTTGSALTFDGTKLSLPTVLAIKGAQNSNLARIAMTRTDASYSINNETDLRFYGQTTDTESPANILHSMNIGGTFVWNNGSGSEQMRLTSTGLGIGTSSPGYALDVYRASGTASYIVGENGSGVKTAIGVAGDNGSLLGTLSAHNLRIVTGGAVAATVDTSGNLGLGVTPSAWNSGVKALQINRLGFQGNGSSGGVIAANAYYGASAWTYINSDYATSYEQSSGQHKWFTAPSGTAGNTFSFTQAMTLNAAGNLLLGSTTAPSGFARVSLVGGESSGSGANSGIQLTYNASTFGGGAITTVNAAGGGLSFYTFTGNVGSESYTERARIDSSGNLLVGTTSVGANSSGNGSVIYGGADAGLIYMYRSSGTDMFRFYVNNSQVGRITTTSSATSYVTSSDYRLKENIQPMTGALAKVAALKPVTYKWKADGSDGEGFIAHELAEVVPQCVTGEKDAVDADGNPVYQGIDTSFLVATLTAAIQEQQAIIESLKADVAALKGAA